MWDWDASTIGIALGIAGIVLSIPGAIVALVTIRNWITRDERPFPEKVFLNTKVWVRIAAPAVPLLIVGGILWISPQANRNGDTAQATSTAHQNAASTPKDDYDPVPSKASPESRRPTSTQTPGPTLVPTSTPRHSQTLVPAATPTPTLNPVPTHAPTPGPTAKLHPTQEPAPTTSPTATPVPIPASTPVPTLTLSPTILPEKEILSVVIYRYSDRAQPFDVQVLSDLVTGVDGLSVEIHNAVCNNTERIHTLEYIELRCGYYKETREQTVIEHITAWHESVGHLQCETKALPNSSKMEFECFIKGDAHERSD